MFDTGSSPILAMVLLSGNHTSARVAASKLKSAAHRCSPLRFASEIYNSLADYVAFAGGNALTVSTRPRLIVYYNP